MSFSTELRCRLFTAVVVVVIFCTAVTASEECIVHSDNFCRCSTKNKSLTIDISGLFHYPVDPTPSGTKYTWEFSPCSQVHCGGVASATPAVVCQHVVSQNVWYALGRQSDVTWTISATNPLTFDIAYKSGDDGRNSRFSFQHTNDASKISFRSENSGLKLYMFTVTGSAIAPYRGGGHGGGGSAAGVIGWVLISIFIVAVVSYFVVGGIYMYVRRGARGREVIPNYAFWTDIPFLIKDGFMFTISPCVTRAQSYRKL